MEPLAPITLQDVHDAARRIRGTALRTPLLTYPGDGGPRISLKLENLQPVGSFKLRGAANAVAALDGDALADGLCTASAGNMARAVAWLAHQHGVPCSVVVPESAPAAKLDPLRALRTEVVPVSFDDWWQAVQEGGHPALTGTFLHPFASALMMAGNGTIGLELVEDLPELATVIVPFGGGGLSSGIACAVKALRPDVRVFAAEVQDAAPLSASLKAGEPASVKNRHSWVDGIGSGGLHPAMWPIVSSVLDGSITVTLDQVADALRLLAARARVVAEGAGAAALAAALTGKAGDGPLVAVISGGNIDSSRLAEIVAAS